MTDCSVSCCSAHSRDPPTGSDFLIHPLYSLNVLFVSQEFNAVMPLQTQWKTAYTFKSDGPVLAIFLRNQKLN